MPTNRPDFDRLVNTWLPYQVYASRLFGRIGPNQRGGAFGFRDQLQDVLPLILIEPRLTRAQIVLHAGQQFLEGDVLNGGIARRTGTGLGQRTKAARSASVAALCAHPLCRQTGDRTVLDETSPFLEGPAVPTPEETYRLPRVSRESASVYEHARRDRLYAAHIGANGLPLLGAGDWNDGIDALGRRGRGTERLDGLFLNVLDRFAPWRARERRGVRRALRRGAGGGCAGARSRLARRPLCCSTSPMTARASTSPMR